MKSSMVKSVVLICSLLAAGCVSVSERNGEPSMREGTKTEVVAYLSDLERRVARFDIPVNFTTNSTYDAFELKASTNNYSHLATEDVRLQYYSQSEMAYLGRSRAQAAADNPNRITELQGVLDRMWIFTCTSFSSPDSDFSGDNRSYRFIKNTDSIGTDGWGHQLLTVVVLVDTEALERHPESDWERPWLVNMNNELVWSWTRCSYTVDGDPIYEKERGSNSVLWRPIAPTCWYSEMPKWATDQLGECWPRTNLANQMLLH